jgi:uncharacterized protein YdeI (YjbR/CyaY-like superfamily)
MASNPRSGPPSGDRRSNGHEPERRREPRLPEELTAVITDSAVASALFERLPEQRQQSEARWVAAAEDRDTRARRAVDVVRNALADVQSPDDGGGS